VYLSTRTLVFAFSICLSCNQPVIRAKRDQSPRVLKKLGQNLRNKEFRYLPRAMLDFIAAELTCLMSARIPNFEPAVQLVAEAEYFCNEVMADDEREELLYYKAQLADLIGTDIGRDTRVRSVDSDGKRKNVRAVDEAIVLYEKLQTTAQYGAFAGARLKQLRLVKPHLVLLSVFGHMYDRSVTGFVMWLFSSAGFLDTAGGNTAVLVLCNQVLADPNAKPMHVDALNAIQCVEKRFRIDRD
jgi:hypothetical protein